MFLYARAIRRDVVAAFPAYVYLARSFYRIAVRSVNANLSLFVYSLCPFRDRAHGVLLHHNLIG